MSLMITKIEKVYVEAVLICPECGNKVGPLLPGKKYAIDAGKEFVCAACGTVFEVYLTSPDTQRSPTLRAPVQPEQKCPACDGIGSMKFLWLTLHCSTCHGSGISNRSVGG